MDSPAPTATTPARRPLHFGTVLMLSLAIYCGIMALDQAIRWTDHWQGFMSGLIHCVFLWIGWAVIIIPWMLVVKVLYRWRGWQRHRTFWMILPSVLLLSAWIGMLILQPPTAARRFETVAKTELPANARDLRAYFSGGGLADPCHQYCFETTPDQVDRLIAEMELPEDTGNQPAVSSPVPTGWPDVRGWDGARRYDRWDDRNLWHYVLITDRTRTRVFIVMSSI